MANQLGQKGATFKNVWNAFETQEREPCSNPLFVNQCAIRVSQALLDCEVDLSGFRGTRCWDDDGKYNRKHIIRAEELANSLKASPLIGLRPMETAVPGKFQAELAGKTGIIFFKDYWQREINNQRETPANRSGDHIDLWNMNKTTGHWWGWSRDFQEWMSGDVSDRNNSREIWFWGIP